MRPRFAGARSYSGRRRPRSVWFALGNGIVLCLLVFALLLTPVLTLVGFAAAAAPVVPLPFVAIGVTTFGGFALAAGLLAAILVVRQGWIAWVLSAAAVIATVVVSLAPLPMVALAAVDGAGQIIPFITGWIEQARSGF